MWDSDTEAAEIRKGIQEGLQVVHQQRDIHSIQASSVHGCVVQCGAPAVRDRVANDPIHLQR